MQNILLYSFFIFVSFIFLLNLIVLIKILSLKGEKQKNNTKEKTKSSNFSYFPLQQEEYLKDNNIEIIFAIIQPQIEEINKKILELYEKLQTTTKTEILKEIEFLSSKVKNLETHIEKIKSSETEKRQELKKQIQTTFETFEQIKELLKIDYENLLVQKEQLKKYLNKQELEYNNIVEKYTQEIKNLQELILDLRQNYPQDLLEKLKIETSKKTQILEKLQKEYTDLKQTTQQKLKFLDDVLNKKSDEIKVLVSSLKQQNEQELVGLETTIQQLKEQINLLDTEIKSVIRSIYEEQQQKSEIVQKLNTELKDLKTRQQEINSLKLKEDFLKKEIENLNKEYEEMHKEYKELSYKKAEGIKQIQSYAQQQVEEITKQWQQQEDFYQKEINRLKKRLQTLQNRKEKLLKIQQNIQEKFSFENKELQQKIFKEKEAFEKKKTEFENIIRKNISKMENIYTQTKQNLQKLKTTLQQKLQIYNDKILELKKRGEIREERIKKDIEKSQVEYEKILSQLNSEIEQTQKEVIDKVFVLSDEKKQQNIKILAQKERLSLFQTQIKEIIEKIAIVKKDVYNYQQEVDNLEKEIYGKFDNLSNTITKKKEFLIDKFRQMLTEQEVSIIKIFEKSKEIKNYEKL